MSVLSKRREKRKKQDKWVLGEKLTKAGRSRGRRRKTMKKVEKVLKTGGKVTTQRPDTKSKAAYKMGAEHKKALGKKQKIRKGAKEVLITKGGAYAKYGKKSKAAGSFKSAFAKNCKGKGAGDSFNWDGRSYSCSRASDKKKVSSNKPVAETKKVASKKPVKATKKNKELVAIPELGPGKKYTKRQKTLYYRSKR